MVRGAQRAASVLAGPPQGRSRRAAEATFLIRIQSSLPETRRIPSMFMLCSRPFYGLSPAFTAVALEDTASSCWYVSLSGRSSIWHRAETTLITSFGTWPGSFAARTQIASIAPSACWRSQRPQSQRSGFHPRPCRYP